MDSKKKSDLCEKWLNVENMKKRILVIPLVMFLAGCGEKEPQVRQYVEYVDAVEPVTPVQQAGLPGGHPDISGESGHFAGDGEDHTGHNHPPFAQSDMTDPDAPKVSFEKPKLQWLKPESWTQEPGGNAMRLATFKVSDAGKEATTTIVALGGAAGGLQSNISRWLGQLDVQVDAATLATYIEGLPTFTTSSGLKGHLVDLSSWVAEDAESMQAAIISAADQSIFVKMTGAAPLLLKEKAAFTALCESISN